MEIVKKWGIAILCVVALIALFLPMATIETTTDYEFLDSSTSISGFTVAFQGYVCMVLIVGPVVILAADYIALAKKLKAVLQAGVSVLGILLTFVGYLQASKIAAAGDAVGMGYADVEASLGIGGVLCLICYAGILVLTLLFQKDELKKNVEELKGLKEN